ncbi:hypothetical protein TNCV_3040671 [Trichonephila clavipes]|nr:hypothetical protein TNCV_3040671 [Trichonephila clavipes]
MDSLGHLSFPPTALGRQDDEEAIPGLTTLDLNTLSTLYIPFLFLELIGNIREFIFPKKTHEKVSGKVPYRFVTTTSKKKTGFIRRSQTA